MRGRETWLGLLTLIGLMLLLIGDGLLDVFGFVLVIGPMLAALFAWVRHRAR